MRACIYTRVSSDPKARGRSVGEQEADCRAVCEREGWQVVSLFSDNDRSASRYAKAERPAYRQLVEFVESGGCDVLVTWEASRFQRDLEDYVRLRELCRRQQVMWCYSGRTYDLTRTDDRLTTGLDALLAERESDMTRERVLRAVRANAVKGRPHGRLLYGYRREYDPSSGELLRQVVNEPEAAIVREAAARFLAGETTGQIAKDLNRRQVPTPAGGVWDLTRVRRIIEKPAYIGQRVHQGVVIGPADWPPILTEADHHRIVARLADPARKVCHDSAVRYLLTGIAKCGVCGARMKFGHPRGYPSYVCSAMFCTARKLEPVDRLVTGLILARLSRPDARALFTPDDRDTVGPLLEQIAERRARLDGFYDAASRGEVSPAALGRIEVTLLCEIEALEGSIRRVDVPTTVFDLLADPQRVWDGLTVTQRREVVRTLVDVTVQKIGPQGRAKFDPEGIAVTWRGSAGAPPAARPSAVGPQPAAARSTPPRSRRTA